MTPSFFEGCAFLFKIKMFIDPCNTRNAIKIYQLNKTETKLKQRPATRGMDKFL